VAGNLQIIGGGFQDAEGNLLVNGYLLFELSHDELYSAGNSQIVAGLKFRVNLNTVGSISANPAVFIYANASLTPSGSYYLVRAFKADGTEAWASPQMWVFAATPNPFDLGTQVPANPPGAGLNIVSSTSRIASFNFQVDGGGSAITTGAKGQWSVPTACTVTGWVLTADQSGSCVIDVLKSSYAGFPSTASIASTDKPTLSSAQKNENLALSVWTTALAQGDELQINVNSASTVTRVNLSILVSIP
jgi:hypothetical protein